MDMTIEKIWYDGFLRITLESVLESKFVHLMSGLNPVAQGQVDGACIVWSSGFSEWYSLDSRPISIGWDWNVVADRDGGLTLKRVGPLQSNVMLIDRLYRDFGWAESLQLLGTVVDALPWQEPVWHRIPSLSPV